MNDSEYLINVTIPKKQMKSQDKNHLKDFYFIKRLEMMEIGSGQAIKGVNS